MSKTTRILTLLAGAGVLAGLTYTFGRMALRPRASHSEMAGGSARDTEIQDDAWQSALLAAPSPSDALDRALDLDGLFDPEALTDADVTVRLQGTLPHATGADDADPPDPEELGSAWLRQATESESSLSEANLTPDVENLPTGSALQDVLDEDAIGDDELGDLDDLDPHVRGISQGRG